MADRPIRTAIAPLFGRMPTGGATPWNTRSPGRCSKPRAIRHAPGTPSRQPGPSIGAMSRVRPPLAGAIGRDPQSRRTAAHTQLGSRGRLGQGGVPLKRVTAPRSTRWFAANRARTRRDANDAYIGVHWLPFAGETPVNSKQKGLRSRSVWQRGNCAGVTPRQGTAPISLLSWSRQRRNTASRMRRITSRSTYASAITTRKDSA